MRVTKSRPFCRRRQNLDDQRRDALVSVLRVDFVRIPNHDEIRLDDIVILLGLGRVPKKAYIQRGGVRAVGLALESVPSHHLFLDPESFDLCVSYLNQCDLPDFMANKFSLRSWPRKGAKRATYIDVPKPVFARENKGLFATGGWHRSEEGEKLHVILDRYFEETERRWRIICQDR